MDVVVKMKLDRLVVLYDPHSQERLHEDASSDVEILGILPQKLVLELGTCCGVHQVVHKQAVDNEVLTLALHENCLFTGSHSFPSSPRCVCAICVLPVGFHTCS